MKYFIIAGESSGDLYGGLLMKALRSVDQDAEFAFWGGPQMKEVSSNQLKSIKETAFMGFVEVAKNIFNIRQLFIDAKKHIADFSPDLIIFIDYPGFNLRMTTWAKAQGYRTCYYISPQLWAWKEGRHTILRDYVDDFIVILPFERDFYKNLDTPCQYFGHPLMEVIDPSVIKDPVEVETIGLFPGSRKQEIERHLPLMVNIAGQLPHFKFIIAGLSHIQKSLYLDNIPKYHNNLDIVYDNSYSVMRSVDAAITSSGTATLELALHRVPQVIIYKTNPISFSIGKKLVKTDHIGLVNLIAQKRIVPELLQRKANTESVGEALRQIISPEYYERILNDYERVSADLGDGQTSQKIATYLFGKLQS
ncbi:MAG: lipid-A-disaccharide synthase [Saprospiraceae bacterium]|nr:lipid-A-disaccharide synthase [Saprospiraceae bacterium]